jgi:integrase
VLQGCLDLAVADEMVKRNPAFLRAMPVVMTGCDLRVAEAMAVALEDFDFDEMILHVRRQLKKLGRDHIYGLLRHYYASVMLHGGVSVKELAEYLGHHDPAFTLRVYSHLIPGSHERARQVFDAHFPAARRGRRNRHGMGQQMITPSEKKPGRLLTSAAGGP